MKGFKVSESCTSVRLTSSSGMTLIQWGGADYTGREWRTGTENEEANANCSDSSRKDGTRNKRLVKCDSLLN